VAKRLFDIVLSLTALIVCAPLLLLAAAGIRMSSRGPVLYRAQRAGRDGAPFLMHKFRTMRCDQGPAAPAITSRGDRRVFAFGRLLRTLKIDELPQLYDVLRGKMSLVGPRPEDLRIVRDHYAAEHWQTLRVRPGIASPGSIYSYTHGEKLLGHDAPERDYLEKLLPVKLALELVYVRRASLFYDLRLLARTAAVIALIALGKKEFRDPPELARIDRVVPTRGAVQGTVA
jgi:lipopolysaccharide/colanic/teichoic acid biosynthesis glycosyltransferase